MICMASLIYKLRFSIVRNLFFVLLACLLSIPAYAASKEVPLHKTVSFENLPPLEHKVADSYIIYLAKITDHLGHIYFLKEFSRSKLGIAEIELALSSENDLIKEQQIYTSTYDPVMGGCLPADSQNKKPDIRAFLNKKLVTVDVDADHNEDLLLLVREQICSTRKNKILGFVISPTKESITVTPVGAGE